MSNNVNRNSLQWLVYGAAEGLTNFPHVLLPLQSLTTLQSNKALDRIWLYLDELLEAK